MKTCYGTDLETQIEERLRALASARDLTVEALLRQVVDERFTPAPPLRLATEDWARQFEEWADSFPDAALIPDEALSRENLYPDRLKVLIR